MHKVLIGVNTERIRFTAEGVVFNYHGQTLHEEKITEGDNT